MEKDLIIDGLKIHYSETGVPEGQPIILLHGWGCNHTTVRSIAKYLEPEMRVINIDLPGHGESGEPDMVWGTKDFANLIHKIVEEINIENPVLIGHSFGGRTSISYASEYPVRKLILVDAAGIKPVRSLNYYYKVYSYKAYKKLLNLILGEEKSRKLIEKALKKRGSSDYLSSTPVMRAIMSKCVNEDLKHIMPKIKCPTLLIWGEEDTATPLGDAKLMEKLIPDAGLVSYPGCGHYSFLDNPFGFKTVLREFLKAEIQSSKENVSQHDS